MSFSLFPNAFNLGLTNIFVLIELNKNELTAITFFETAMIVRTWKNSAQGNCAVLV